jgi:hypothetical protein
MEKRAGVVLALLLGAFAAGMGAARGVPQAAPKAEWLTGSTEERFARVEKQLRGMDVAMIEVGYRFTELHYVGQDGNWDYAKYLAEKMDLAIRLALERRPKRAKSAQLFLDGDLPVMRKAIESRDRRQFAAAMERLRAGCTKCHANEDVPYFTVELPQYRQSPIRTVR